MKILIYIKKANNKIYIYYFFLEKKKNGKYHRFIIK